MARQKTDEIDELLQPVFAAFRSRAAAAISETREQMQNVLRVDYDAEKACLPKSLPAPRLQLRWEGDGYESVCHYELVFPLRDLDCRNDAKKGHAVVQLGRTKVGGGGRKPWEAADPNQALPYRDGAHSSWDAEVFGFPVYVISPDGKGRLVPKREPSN